MPAAASEDTMETGDLGDEVIGLLQGTTDGTGEWIGFSLARWRKYWRGDVGSPKGWTG
jgi:hypothetical protein